MSASARGGGRGGSRGGARGGRPTKAERMKRDAAADPLQSKFVLSRHWTLDFNGAPMPGTPAQVFGNKAGTSANATAGPSAVVTTGQKRSRDVAVDEQVREDEQAQEDELEREDTQEREDEPEGGDAPPGAAERSLATSLVNGGNGILEHGNIEKVDQNKGSVHAASSALEKDGQPVVAASSAAVKDPVLKSKRRKYSNTDKERIMTIFKTNDSNRSATVRDVQNEANGFESLARQTVSRWAVPKEPKKMGRKIEFEFEKDVLANLMFFGLRDVDADTQKLVVIANAAYSYMNIRHAAVLAQQTEKWKSHAIVKNLKFSTGWIQDFLERNGLRRRRLTTTDKVVPPVAEVAARMEKIQRIIVDNGLEPSDVINADETGIKIILGQSQKINMCQRMPSVRPPLRATKRRASRPSCGALPRALWVPHLLSSKMRSLALSISRARHASTASI